MTFVCADCIQHPSLAEYIRANASAHKCTYCDRRWKYPQAISFDDLVAFMTACIETEYEDAANSVGYDSAEGGYLLPSMDGSELLGDLDLDLDNEGLLDDLAGEFSDCPWVHKDPYGLSEEEERSLDWKKFVHVIKHRVRYLLFPPNEEGDHERTAPSEMLDELGKLFRAHELTSPLKAGTELFRVRLHKPGQAPPNAANACGPPPIIHARFANRMSPAGVSMFYVALDKPTALAESYVRHDRKPAEATIAVFKLIEDLTVLNLVNLPPVPSIFDEDESPLNRAALVFLHEFNHDFTQTVQKDGREHIDYVPSQVVTEFVRYRLSVTVGRPVHGILYKSARRPDGIGCVLFYAYEDLVEHAWGGPLVTPPFEFMHERTRTKPVGVCE